MTIHNRSLFILSLFICLACGATELWEPGCELLKTVDIPLVRGIDQSVDPEVQPWAITEADNLRFDRPGELASRTPMLQEYVPGTRVRRLLDLNGSVAALVESYNASDYDLLLARRNDTTGAWSVENNATGSRGNISGGAIDSEYVPLVSDARRTVVYSQAATTVYHHAVAVYGQYRMHVFGFSGSIRIAFFRGNELLQLSPAYTLVLPKVFAVNANIDGTGVKQGWVVSAMKTATDEIVVIKIPEVVPTSWPAAVALSVDSAETGVHVNPSYRAYDMVWPAGSSYFYYVLCGDSGEVFWFRANYNGADRVTLVASGVFMTTIALSDSGAVVVWTDAATSHLHGAVLNPTTKAVVVASTVIGSAYLATRVAVSDAIASSKAIVYGSKVASIGTPAIDASTATYPSFHVTTGVVGTLAGNYTAFNWELATQSVRAAGRDFVGVRTGTDNDGMRRFAVFALSSDSYWPFPVMVGDPFVGYLGTAISGASIVNKPVYVDGRLYFAVLEYNDDESAVQAVLYDCEINGTHVGQTANDGTRNAAEASGGLPVTVDAIGSVENVPITYPVLAASAGAGTGITATVTYIAIFEVQDAQGRIGWSAPSPATAPLALTNQNALVTIEQLQLTRTPYGRDPRYRLYRSTTSGPYYQVTTGTLARNAYGYLTYTDSVADLSANPMLYSDGSEGSEAERFCPPHSTVVAVHKNRVWSASGSRAYFSQILDNEFMPQFSDVFYVSVPARITGFASSGDFLWILTEDPDGLYYIQGDGPDATGASGWYASPTPIAGAPGLPQELGGQNSVIVVDGVLYYRSSRGIEAMQGGAVELISEPIRETMATYPVVLGVSYWPERGDLVWLCGVDSGATGRKTFVYNTRTKGWTTHSAGGYTSADTAAYYSNSLIMAGRDGIWRTDTTKTADETAASVKTAITETLSVEGRPFGLNGFGAVRYVEYVGTGAGRFQTEMTVTNDGTVNENASTHTWEETDKAVGAQLELQHKLWRPRCSEVTIQLRPTGLLQSTTYRLPPTWHGISVELERIPGSRRTIAAERF